MITYDIDYSPQAIRDMDDIFDDLQDKIESMAKHPKTGIPLYYV